MHASRMVLASMLILPNLHLTVRLNGVSRMT
jgi:hypothetical protein